MSYIRWVINDSGSTQYDMWHLMDRCSGPCRLWCSKATWSRWQRQQVGATGRKLVQKGPQAAGVSAFLYTAAASLFLSHAYTAKPLIAWSQQLSQLQHKNSCMQLHTIHRHASPITSMLVGVVLPRMLKTQPRHARPCRRCKDNSQNPVSCAPTISCADPLLLVFLLPLSPPQMPAAQPLTSCSWSTRSWRR